MAVPLEWQGHRPMTARVVAALGARREARDGVSPLFQQDPAEPTPGPAPAWDHLLRPVSLSVVLATAAPGPHPPPGRQSPAQDRGSVKGGVPRGSAHLLGNEQQLVVCG